MSTTTTASPREALRERLQALKLHGLELHLEEIADPELPALERWLGWEEQVRSERGLARRLGAAHLGRFKGLVDFDWTWPDRCDRGAIEELMTLEFLAEANNVVLVGPNGVGKSTLAKNLAHQGVLGGHTALFVTASECLADLGAQETDSALRRRLRRYTAPAVLVLDEIGYLSYATRQADLLFEVISQRYERKSTIVTTNRPFAEWGEVFPNAACVVSLIDRLCHHAEIVPIDGESWRRREAEERLTAKKNKRSATTKKRPARRVR